MKQLDDWPQQILVSFKHISWKAFKVLWLFFEAFKISRFIWQNISDHFQILLTWFLYNFFEKQCKQNNLIS